MQEHERGTHGWQVEWLTLPQMLTLTGAALSHAMRLLEALEVDTEQMRHNVERSAGLMLAEALSTQLAAVMPKPEAKALIRGLVPRAAAGEGNLVELVRQELGERGTMINWAALREENYLGSNEDLIDRVLREAGERRTPAE